MTASLAPSLDTSSASQVSTRLWICAAAGAVVLHLVLAAFAFAHLGLPNFSVPDGAATLAALTAQAVARVVPRLPRPPKSWIVAGGGARNRTIVRMLERLLAPARLETADMVGWSGDALEAQAFAFLAVRTLRGLPITFPTTTGAPRPLTGGVVAKAG